MKHLRNTFEVKPIEYVCLLGHTGYATAARDTILSLDKNGFDVSIRSINGSVNRKVDSMNHKRLRSLLMKDIADDRIQIFNVIPSMQRRFVKSRAETTVGFSVFETFSPPEHWSEILNRNDMVVAPSNFCAEIFKKIGTNNVVHIPHCINEDIFNAKVTASERRNKFTFLFVGTWKDRKNYKELVKAWGRGFSGKDGFQLILKIGKSEKEKASIEVDSIYKDLGIKSRDNLVLDDTVYSDKELASLMKSAHCVVLPSRGEGFGLPVAQAMALDVPTISSGFSGLKDFVNENTSVVLHSEKYEKLKMMDNYPQFRNKLWAVVSSKQIQKKMEFAYKNYDELRKISKEACKNIRTCYTSVEIARIWREKLKDI